VPRLTFRTSSKVKVKAKVTRSLNHLIENQSYFRTGNAYKSAPAEDGGTLWRSHTHSLFNCALITFWYSKVQ